MSGQCLRFHSPDRPLLRPVYHSDRFACCQNERTRRWAPAHAAQCAARLIAALAEIARAEVGQLVMFRVAPDVFDRIEVRGVGRQALDREPAPLRPFVRSAFVDEDDRAPLAAGFFLIRGHVTLCHCRIACSSRSSALPLGRWQLQLSLRRMRQTWSSWYRTP